MILEVAILVVALMATVTAFAIIYKRTGGDCAP
jgi:hypothetical protein